MLKAAVYLRQPSQFSVHVVFRSCSTSAPLFAKLKVAETIIYSAFRVYTTKQKFQFPVMNVTVHRRRNTFTRLELL